MTNEELRALIDEARRVATYPYPEGSELYERLADALEDSVSQRDRLTECLRFETEAHVAERAALRSQLAGMKAAGDRLAFDLGIAIERDHGDKTAGEYVPLLRWREVTKGIE